MIRVFPVCNSVCIIWAPVFRVCDQLKLKSTCSATQTSQSLEIWAIASKDIILSKQRTTKVLIRLCGCAGWSAPLLFAYGINRYSHDVSHFILEGFYNKFSIFSGVWIFQTFNNKKFSFFITAQIPDQHRWNCCSLQIPIPAGRKFPGVETRLAVLRTFL